MSDIDSNSDGVIDGVSWDQNADGVLDSLALDSDQNGVFETTGYNVDLDGEFDIVAVDNDQNGLVESVGVDEFNDGVLDTVVRDTNLDGQLDMVFRDHDLNGVEDFLQLGSVDVGPVTNPDPFYTLTMQIAEETGRVQGESPQLTSSQAQPYFPSTPDYESTADPDGDGKPNSVDSSDYDPYDSAFKDKDGDGEQDLFDKNPTRYEPYDDAD